MRVGGEGGLPHVREEPPEREVRRNGGAEHEGIHEEADQPFELHPVARGGRRADREALLTRPAEEERFEAPEEEHERRHPFGPGQLGQAQGRQLPEERGAPERLHGRARAVERQLQHGRQPRELLAPEPEVVPLMLPLPRGVVRGLERQLRQDRALVEGRHLVPEDRERPGVRDDVVHGDEEEVLRLGKPHEGGAQERPPGEVEGTPGVLRREALRLFGPPGQVHHGEVKGSRGRDPLHGPAALTRERGAQGLVPADDLRQRPGEGGGIERPREADRARDVIGRVSGLEAVEEPEPLLAEGERERRPSRATGARDASSAARPPRRAASISPARAARVEPNSARSGSSTPNVLRTRETAWRARSECPPSSKKPSEGDTRSTPSTSAQIPASSSSTGVRISSRRGRDTGRNLRGAPLRPHQLREHRQAAEPHVRIGGDRREERRERREQALDRRGVEEVGRGLDRHRQAPARLGDGEREVELGRSAVDPLGRRPDEAAGLDPRPEIRLQGEEHLEQRVRSRGALRSQPLHDLFQGEVGARDRRQSVLARPGQKLAERQVAPGPAAQHDRVDEEAEEPVQLLALPDRDGRAHEEVAPAGDPEEEGLEGGEEEDERGRPLLPRELPEARREIVRQRRPPAHAPEARNRRPGPVRGQGEQGWRARQALPLPGEPLDERRTAQRRALPERHVRLLEGRLGERLPGVEGRQLTPEQVERPAVRHRVVLDDEQPVLPRGELRERRPQERPAPEVERAAGLLFERGGVDPRQIDRGRRQHPAPGPARGRMAGNTVRSTSWRRTTSESAAASASRSRGPVIRNAAGTL